MENTATSPPPLSPKPFVQDPLVLNTPDTSIETKLNDVVLSHLEFGEGKASAKPEVSLKDQIAAKEIKVLEAGPGVSKSNNGKDSGLGLSPPLPSTTPIRPNTPSNRDPEALEALRAIEEVRPVGTHPANFRQFQVNMEGNKILMALMAHPVMYGKSRFNPKGMTPKEAISKLHAAEYQTLICLDATDHRSIKDYWKYSAQDHPQLRPQIELFNIEDHNEPSTSVLKQIYSKVRESAQKGRRIAIFCGAGFGRSGVIGAAIILIRNLLEQTQEGTLSRDRPTEIAKSTNRFGQLIYTTPEVARAVTRVREEDPENGADLRKYNERASHKGPTVETKGQFVVLEELEMDIRIGLVPY